MTTGKWNQKIGAYRDYAAEQLGPMRERTRAGCEKIWSRVSATVCSYLLSEVCIFKMMLISFGLLVGATFSDFFKKHRIFLFVAFLGSAALFLYKAFQMLEEIDEETDF